MITLTPSPDELPDLVRVLVDLADSPYDVHTTTDTPSLGLVIPEYLHDRYEKYRSLEDQPEQASLPARKKRSPK